MTRVRIGDDGPFVESNRNGLHSVEEQERRAQKEGEQPNENQHADVDQRVAQLVVIAHALRTHYVDIS